MTRSFAIPPALVAALLCSLAGSANLAAQDREREARLAAEVVDFVMEGEPLELGANGEAFLAIYQESDGPAPKGAAVVMHGRGFHPNWPQVAQPLRTGLPARGWHTLSIQMPVLEKTAKYNDYVPIFPAAFPRIRAAVDHLRAEGAARIVLVAHSCSVHMTMAFVERFGDGDIDAYVGVGMGATDYGQPMKGPFPLAAMKVPVLDLYGGEDYPAVLRTAPERVAAIRAAGHPKSRQAVVPGADHFFKGHDDDLVDAVSAWLDGL